MRHTARGGVCATVSVKQAGWGCTLTGGAGEELKEASQRGKARSSSFPPRTCCVPRPQRGLAVGPRWSGSLAPEHADVTGEEPRSKRQG